MGLRFRRRVKLLPGVHLNLSGSGAGLSLGPRGASVSMSGRGIYGNVGIPGTGLYAREKLSGTSRSRPKRRSSSSNNYVTVSTTITISDDGSVRFLDKDGNEYFRHEGFFAKDELIKVLKMQGVN